MGLTGLAIVRVSIVKRAAGKPGPLVWAAHMDAQQTNAILGRAVFNEAIRIRYKVSFEVSGRRKASCNRLHWLCEQHPLKGHADCRPKERQIEERDSSIAGGHCKSSRWRTAGIG